MVFLMVLTYFYAPLNFELRINNKKISLAPIIREARAATCGTNGVLDGGGLKCTYETVGADTFTVPANVYSIDISCWGGGGGGEDGANKYGSGGGGGGAYAASTIAVTPTTEYNLSVGNGGEEDTNGDNSTFNTNTVIAEGGKTGASETGGNGGDTTVSVGNAAEYKGGGGGDGDTTDDAGGGGGGAGGPDGAGIDGSNATATTGGDGGAGDDSSGGAGGGGGDGGDGSPGTANTNGGGGGGGGDNGSGGGNGGTYGAGGGGGEVCDSGTQCTGAAGACIITWVEASVPTVTTQEASAVANITATFNGNITNTGGNNAATRGFAYGTDSSLSNGDTSTTTESGSFGTGAFTYDASGLTCNTSYYFRAYATNGAGTGLGSIQSTTTLACTAPSFTANVPDESEDPNGYGTTVDFTATANDPDDQDWYLAVCDSNSVTVAGGAGDAPACDAGEFCVSSATTDNTEASCATTTEIIGSNTWYAFACDADHCSVNSNANSPLLVVGNIALGNHTAGQVSNKFEEGVSSTSTELFRFKLTPEGETASTTLALSLSSVTGISAGDITSGNIYADSDNNGLLSAGEISAGSVFGCGSPSDLSGGSGTITCNSTTTISSATDYIYKATVGSLESGDKITIGLSSSDVIAYGNTTVTAKLTVSGSATNISHGADQPKTTVPAGAAYGYAYNYNIGWIKFHNGNLNIAYGVTIGSTTTDGTDLLTGYAWSENAGWIKMAGNCSEAGGCPDGGNSYSVKISTSTDDCPINNGYCLTGYAWGEGVGWISFATSTSDYSNTSDSTYGVYVDEYDDFKGYAWGEQVGWISFSGTCSGGDCPGASSTTYGVEHTYLNATDHTLGQVSNQWSGVTGGINTVHYRFKLTSAGEKFSVGTTTINLSNVSGVVTSNISSAKLYFDNNSDGASTSESMIVGYGNASISDTVGTIVFATSTTYDIATSASVDFLAELTVTNIQKGDTMTMDFGGASITGVESGGETVSTDATDDPDSVRHGTPILTQSAYRLFNNIASTSPGTAMTTLQDQPGSLTTDGQAFRLRALMKISSSSMPQSSMDFALYFAAKGTGSCASPASSYATVTPTTAIAFYDNDGVSDGTLLTATATDPINGAEVIVNQTYEEANNFTNSEGNIDPGENGKWDFSLYDYDTLASTTYCFKIVNADSSDLDNYSVYPEITTGPPWTIATQTAGIIENDQNSDTLTSHTAKIGERLRVKIQLETETGKKTPRVYKLQYDKSDDSWQEVVSANEIRSALSTVIKNSMTIGGPEAGSCPGGTTWAKGKAYEGTNRTKAIVINGNKCTELAFTIDTASANTGTTYRFRLINLTSSSTFSVYSAYPSFTTVGNSSNNKNYSKAKTSALSTTTPSMSYLLDNQGYDNANTDDNNNYESVSNTILDTVEDFILDTPDTIGNSQIGKSVVSGDFNGDGIDDLLVGNASSSMSKVFIIFGKTNQPAAAGSSADVTLSNPNTSSNTDYFGYSVNTGDFNADGYADAMVGAYFYDTSMGRAYIFYGSADMSSTSTADVTLDNPEGADRFGYSLASGDFNADGYADAMVGAYYYSSSAGRAYIFYGSSDMSSTSTANIIFDNPTGAQVDWFGHSMTAGDFNSDGYEDALIGAYRYNDTYYGRAYIFYGSNDMSSTSTANIIFDNPGGSQADRFGYSVSSGDFNGDGYADALVGAYGYSAANYYGRSYIFYGSASMSDTSTADITFSNPGGSQADRFGSFVSSGDLNGDGYADAIAGAYSYSNNGDDGRVYAFYGGSLIDNAEERIITVEPKGWLFGSDNAYAGDVNGDGYDDYIISDYESNAGTYATSGAAYLYYGGKTISTTTALSFYGNEALCAFGSDVDGGDFNGDGYSDLIIGAYAHDAGSSTASDIGQAYIYFGGPNINPASPDVTVSGDYDTIYFGNSVGNAGDVNGDGYDDFLVGAPYHPAGNTNRGRAYLYYGGATIDTAPIITITGSEDNTYLGFDVHGAGDVNGDGYGDFIIGAYMHDAGSTTASNLGQAYIYLGGPGLDSIADITLSGDDNNARFGAAVAGSGDVNADGYDDVIVGAYAHSNFSGEDTRWGRAYIYHGAQNMDNIPDFTILSNEAGAWMGLSVNKAGDVNGDGYGDVIVGAELNDADGTPTQDDNQRGEAYVFFGSPNMGTSSNVNDADIFMQGKADLDFFGIDVSYAGDVNGDGYGDFLSGLQRYKKRGQSYLYLGGQSVEYPTYSFKNQSLFECDTLDSITATWDGQSTINSETENIKLELYHFGTTNNWELASSSSSFASSTDGTLTIATTTNLSEYCDTNDWSYWRVYQEPSSDFSQTFMTDYWDVDFSYSSPTTKPYRMEGTIKIERDVKFQ